MTLLSQLPWQRRRQALTLQATRSLKRVPRKLPRDRSPCPSLSLQPLTLHPRRTPTWARCEASPFPLHSGRCQSAARLVIRPRRSAAARQLPPRIWVPVPPRVRVLVQVLLRQLVHSLWALRPQRLEVRPSSFLPVALQPPVNLRTLQLQGLHCRSQEQVTAAPARECSHRCPCRRRPILLRRRNCI